MTEEPNAPEMSAGECAVVGRLRAALDEVAGDVDSDLGGSVIPLRQRPGGGKRRWVVAAAAAAVAIIGATTVVVRRDEPAGVASPPSEAATPEAPTIDGSWSPAPTGLPITAGPPLATTATLPPSTTVPDGSPDGVYELDLPWLHGQSGTASVSYGQQSTISVWVNAGNPTTAALVMAAPAEDGTGPNLPVVRESASGERWTLGAAGLSVEQIDALAAQVVPGSGVPYVLPDPSMTLLTFRTPHQDELTTTTYVDDAGQAVIVRSGDAAELFVDLVRDAVSLSTSPVIEQQAVGLRAARSDGSIYVLWQADVERWGSVQIPAALASRADEIIAGLRTVPAAAAPEGPALLGAPGTYRLRGLVIDDGRGPMVAFGLMESYPPQGGTIPLAGWSWDSIDTEQSASGTTWTDQDYVLTGTWDGHVFTVTEPPEAASREGNTLLPTEGCDTAAVDAATATLGSLDLISLGIVLTVPATSDGHCAVLIEAQFDTPELRAALAPIADLVEYSFRFEPVDG